MYSTVVGVGHVKWELVASVWSDNHVVGEGGGHANVCRDRNAFWKVNNKPATRRETDRHGQETLELAPNRV